MRLCLPGLLLLTSLAGCAYGPPPTTPAFDEHNARFMLQHGLNVIVGRAAGQDGFGHYASCAGDSAILIPDTPYTRYRLDRLYGGPYRLSAAIRGAPHLPRDPHYQAYVRHAPCGPDGAFEFDRVADGHYIVVAGLHSPAERPGGGISMRQFVQVYGGISRSIVLTQ